MTTYPDFFRILWALNYQKNNCIETASPSTLEGYKFLGDNKQEFFEDINVRLPNAHLFEIEEDVKKLLLLTKAPKDNSDIQFPFPNTYIDVQLTKEELAELGIKLDADRIFGFLIRRGCLSWDSKIEAGHNLRITTGVQIKNQDSSKDWIALNTINVRNVIDYEPFKDFKTKNILADLSRRDKKIVGDFIVNVLNFINNPEVKMLKVERSEKNMKRRIRQGKIVLPSSYKVVLTGVLKEYLDEVRAGRHFSYSYKFWVKGTYRHLRSIKFKNKKGIKIWIKPFKKGQGVLIEKIYVVKKENEKKIYDVEDGGKTRWN